jgi:hypothetical protein
LSWWDDVTFIVNDYRVALAWVHPRMEYQDRIQDEALALTEHLRPRKLFDDPAPSYTKLGRSRKKIAYWSRDGAAGRSWGDAVSVAEKRLAKIADFQITPHMDVRWCRYSRLVNLCVPVEVRNIDELRALALLTKRILKREATLQEAFPDYQDTRDDWVREGLADRYVGLHSHRVA